MGTYIKNFTTNCNINCGFILVVVGKEIRIACQEELKAETMSIFRTKMAWGVTINVFCVNISTMLYQCLNDAKISSQTRNVQRSTEVVGPCIYLGSKLD